VQRKLSEGKYYQGNICDKNFTDQVFADYHIDCVFHFATQIDFNVKSQKSLRENNVSSTEVVAALCSKYRVSKLIYTSSNSVYLGNRYTQPFSEQDEPISTDEYGHSKIICEKLLKQYESDFDCVIFRCPNIMDAGRVGML